MRYAQAAAGVAALQGGRVQHDSDELLSTHGRNHNCILDVIYPHHAT